MTAFGQTTLPLKEGRGRVPDDWGRPLRIATVDVAVGGKLLQMRSDFRFAACR
jgi:hypothetical protein